LHGIATRKLRISRREEGVNAANPEMSEVYRLTPHAGALETPTIMETNLR
jgi:hypothetical protein